MAELKLNAGDLVEVYNDNGSTQAMVVADADRASETRPSCCSPTPRDRRATWSAKGVNELIIPNYKQTWGNIRKIADAPEVTRHLSFKSFEYRTS